VRNTRVPVRSLEVQQGAAWVNVPRQDYNFFVASSGLGVGPYTLRDTAGWIGGLLLDPVSYVYPFALALGVRSVDLVNYTSFLIVDYEAIKDASIDPYLATRDAYLQYRADQATK
jgi:hypothetical protein